MKYLQAHELLLRRVYRKDDVADIANDVNFAIDFPERELPKDPSGFYRGTFKVTVEFMPDRDALNEVHAKLRDIPE